MYTDIYSFLSDQTNSQLINFRQRLSRTAKEIEEYFTAGAPETNFLIASKDAEEWLTNLAPVLMHQIVTNKLSSRQVYGLERAHFEEKRPISKHIEKYVNRFSNADITANDYCYQILNSLSISIKEAVHQGGRYHRTQELLTNTNLRLLVASIMFEVWGYNTFTGLYYEIDILKLMAKLDTPINLINEKSIIPARVFSDFVEIEDNVQLIASIGQMKIGNMVDPFFVAFSNDLDRDRNTFEEKLRSYVQRYPCLQGQGRACLGKHLLHYYTLEPLEMFNRFGQDIVCFPFEVPEKFKLTDDEKEWNADARRSNYNQDEISY